MAVESRQQFICEGIDTGADWKFTDCRPIDMPDTVAAARLKAILDTTVDGIVYHRRKSCNTIIQQGGRAHFRLFGR